MIEKSTHAFELMNELAILMGKFGYISEADRLCWKERVCEFFELAGDFSSEDEIFWARMEASALEMCEDYVSDMAFHKESLSKKAS